MAQVADWPGISNGAEWTPNDKMQARIGLDLPEDVDKDIRAKLGVGDEFCETWRAGMVDIMAEDGVANMMVTHAQAQIWQQARRRQG